jgi:hypothetical protein
MTKKKSWVLLLYEEDQESFRLFVGTFWWDSKLGHVDGKFASHLSSSSKQVFWSRWLLVVA